MRNKYSKLTDTQLRELCLKGEIEHKYMSDDDYELLIQHECDLPAPNSVVVNFCRVGMKDLGCYEDFEFLFKRAERSDNTEAAHAPPPDKPYSEMRFDDLRKLLLNGELYHEHMTIECYERLLLQETDFGNEGQKDSGDHGRVLEFCTSGLKRFEQYEGLSDIEIYVAFVGNHASNRDAERALAAALEGKTYRTLHPVEAAKLRKITTGIIITVSVIAAITLTAAAFGYNVFDLVRNAINSISQTATHEGEHDAIFTENERFYNSMQEMLETEKLNILFPVRLPDEYTFTDFEVIDLDNRFEVHAYSLERYIHFIVRIDSNIEIDSYSYEINGISFDVVELDGLYQADWIYNNNHYEIVVDDREILSEIIENLRES
jgi:hypothetical protein